MYERLCPRCGEKIFYRLKQSYLAANGNCKKCASEITACKNRKVKPIIHCVICDSILEPNRRGKTCSEQCRLKLIANTKQIKYGHSAFNNRDKCKMTMIREFGVENVSQLQTVKDKVTMKGRYYSRIDTSGENNPMYQRIRSPETLAKHRKSRIANLEKLHGKLYPGYNPKGCRVLDTIMEQTGTTIQHAENGGEFHIKELGYFVDGYDAENNIVYEYDEKHHFNKDGTLCEDDIRRQYEITNYLNCKFIRIKDETNILKELINLKNNIQIKPIK